jgi:hypothetical protein
MNEYLHTLSHTHLSELAQINKQQTASSLESGKVIYLPTYSFSLLPHENVLLTETLLAPKHKNISYDYRQQRLAGYQNINQSIGFQTILHEFMQRFAEYAKNLVDTLLPDYSHALRWGRTSYRPAEIHGRKSSKRKDDTRLHVDSFSATPVNGLRILRVFCNINPDNVPRVWHLGEPFSQVLKAFAPRIASYSPTRAKLLKLVKATKTLRTSYDHHMLCLHDTMKLDDAYQSTVKKHRIDFPPRSTWIVFTDHVSHAALSGQFLLEQTFYMPVSAMLHPKLSPLKQWEQAKAQVMI